MERITMMYALFPGEKIVVNMGEDHSKPTHKLLQQAVLSGCQDAGILPVLGVELPHDMRNFVIENLYASKAGIVHNDRMRLKDKDGSILLKGFMGCAQLVESPKSSHSLFLFCLKKKIAVQFNDLVRRRRGNREFLDISDEFTSLIVNRVNPAILSSSSEGVGYRNEAMLLKSQQQWRTQKPDILIHQQGLSHVLGDLSQGFLYEDSLAEKFRRAGWHVLNVFPKNCKFSTVEFPLDANVENTIFIRGLDDKAYYAVDSHEKSFVNKVCRQSGNIIESFSVGLLQKMLWEYQFRKFVKQTSVPDFSPA